MGKSRTKNTSRASGKKRKRSKPVVSKLAQRVYNWEAEWHHWNSQQFETIHGPRQWVRHALEIYGVPPTVVRSRHGHESSFFRPHDWSINLLKKHRNVAAALHEAAHAIHAYYYGPVEEHHDERWLGIYVWLLCQSGLWPKSAIVASLAARKLKFSRMMTPKILKHKNPYSE